MNLQKHLNLIRIKIPRQKPSILVLPELQIDGNEPSIDIHFEGHRVISKFFPRMKKARISVLIKEGLKFERIKDIEDEWLSTKWLKSGSTVIIH